MAEREPITVSVPVERIAEFYEWFGRWLAQGEGDRPTEVRPSAWDVERDLELAVEAWRRFPERARVILGTLIDHPDRRFTAEELARRHDIPNGRYGVAGTWAWPGRQLKALGRPLPFSAEPTRDEGSSYWMPPSLARLFSDARRRADGP